MENNKFKTMSENLKSSFPLLFSTAAALCLFLSPTIHSLIFVIIVFISAMIVVSLGLIKRSLVSSRFLQGVSIALALLIAFKGYDKFKVTWSPSSKVAVIVNALHLSSATLLSILGLIGCVVGLYAMFTLSYQTISLVHKFTIRLLPEKRKDVIIANLKENWFLPISALAFFYLYITTTPGYSIGILIAFVAAVIFFSQVSPVMKLAKKTHISLNVISILTGLGVCWRGQAPLHAYLNASPSIQNLQSQLSVSFDIAWFVSVFAAIIALFFVYFCVLIVWRETIKIFSETGIFNGIKMSEWIIYGTVLIISLSIMIVSFLRTQVFYGTSIPYNIIYTSDSSLLATNNAYINLTHPENDLRQPLFAVFAAPFTAIPYLLGKLAGANASIHAILTNSVQVIMLFVANFILTRIMKLNSIKQICFMLLTSCSYTQMLFTLMMEQFVVAYFWLILCIYIISEKRQYHRIVLWGASGTLLTSMILLPFMSEKSPINNFKEWFIDVFKYGLEFIALMLMFCRFDVFFNLRSKINSLRSFTGINLTLMDKLYQYTEFVRYCFLKPNAGVNTTKYSHISWQLNIATCTNSLGIIILVLALISAILNRDKKSSQLAAGWICFSIIILVLLGWGTRENGLVLYALYFGWALLVLLFQLIEKIESKLNVNFILPVISVCVAAKLIGINIPAIMEMLNFAIVNYPV